LFDSGANGIKDNSQGENEWAEKRTMEKGKK
jgi:hypothetical protein